MKTYRIKEHSGGFGTSFEIQCKSIFGFWYNAEHVDDHESGLFESEEEARERIKKLQTPYKTRILNP